MRCCRPPAHRQIRAPSAAGECVSREKECPHGGDSDKGPELVLETDRPLLRPWRVSEAPIQREMWTERDPRVPPHRRIDAEGALLSGLAEAIRPATGSWLGPLAVEPKGMGAAVGYCGLVDSGRGVQEPELAFELLRGSWDRDKPPRRRGRSAAGGDNRWVPAAIGHRLGMEHRLSSSAGEVGFAGDRAAGDPPRYQLRHHEAAELLPPRT